MLHLTRKINEQIRLGEDTTITVVQMLPQRVIVTLIAPGTEITAPIERGRFYDFEVDGENVTVQLQTVVRGECRLSFAAPRSIRIVNAERLGETHAR